MMKLIKNLIIVVVFFAVGCTSILAQKGNSNTLTDMQIMQVIDKHRPSKGLTIPANIKQLLGATHVGGKYFFTDEPYLVEGAKKMYDLGFGVCKLWFYKNQSGYQYNSQWNLPKEITLTELAKHSYYQQAFTVPFSTFILSTSAGKINDALDKDSAGLRKEEEEYYQLASYLLETYKARAVNFVLHNWEGDWVVRGGVGWKAQWGRVEPPADVNKRFEKAIAMYNARQKGVSRARTERPAGKCKVYHAIEVNKVIDCMKGVPGLTTHVLPHVEVDMVSWSAYDATDFDKTGLDLYKGIEFIRSQMKPTTYMKEKVIFLGEIGIPEISTKNLPVEFRERWDTYMAVCLAQDIRYVIQWELYCNEPAKGAIINQPAVAKTNLEMNGFWLIKPDGSKGYAMQYFDEILKQTSGSLKKIK